MRRLAALFPVVALLILTAGCRDVLVDPAPMPQAPPAPAGVPHIYLKGPTTLPITAQANYRAEYVVGVDHYEWRTVGGGAVDIGFPYGGDTRLPVVTGMRLGTIDLIARAYDSQGNVMAIAAKTVTIS